MINLLSDVEPQTTHQHIVDLPFYAALTTNYDRLLEAAYSDPNIPVYIQTDTEELAIAQGKNQFYILKCHGDVHKSESIVLSKPDYQTLIHENRAYEGLISNLFVSNPVLFVGFSLNDTDFELFRETIMSKYRGTIQTHYALMYREHISDYEIEDFWDDGRIRIITYDDKQNEKRPHDPKNVHQQVEFFLEDLKASVLTAEPELEETIIIDGSPFPGLKAFKEKDAHIFFGREQETNELYLKLQDHPLLIVIGASGSGKSSLVGAGLIPMLREQVENLHVIRFTPDDDPIFNLLLADNLSDVIKPRELKGLKPEAIIPKLAEAIAEKTDTKILLFVDQFEELFTLTPEQMRKPFVEMLKQATAQVNVVITMRADFYDRATKFFEEELTRANITLSQPKEYILREMIEKPAELAEITFDSHLVDRIVDDTGDEPGNLALMAYLLDELYKLDDDKHLTHAEYDQLGGVAGAIGVRADEAYDSISTDDNAKMKWLQRVFRELVSVDIRGTATRKRATFDRIAEKDWKWVDEFVTKRLLVKSRDYLEVAHEAILREWNDLAEWIEIYQSDLHIIARVEREAQWWVQRKKLERYLPRAEQIQEFRDACARLEFDHNKLGNEDF